MYPPWGLGCWRHHLSLAPFAMWPCFILLVSSKHQQTNNKHRHTTHVMHEYARSPCILCTSQMLSQSCHRCYPPAVPWPEQQQAHHTGTVSLYYLPRCSCLHQQAHASSGYQALTDGQWADAHPAINCTITYTDSTSATGPCCVCMHREHAWLLPAALMCQTTDWCCACSMLLHWLNAPATWLNDATAHDAVHCVAYGHQQQHHTPTLSHADRLALRTVGLQWGGQQDSSMPATGA